MFKYNWDYKINLSRLHNKYLEEKITFDEYINELVKEIIILKERVTDKTLKDELQNWIDDIGSFYDGKFEHILDDGDETELEFRLDELYDIGDAGKRIWFGI
jgi:hypothetical protein